MAARATGGATISFGLVAIPIKVYSTTQTGASIAFNQINPETGARVKQQLIDGKTGEVLERKSLVKGYEVGKDQYVTFTDEELEVAEVEATKAIDIKEFVPLASVDPVYFEKPYYLGPDKNGSRPYRLLYRAMKDSALCAVGQYAVRGKQYIVLLRPDDHGIVMQQMRYADEIKGWDEVPLGDDVELKDQEVLLARQIVAMSTSEAFDASKYEDSVRLKLQKIIDDKVSGHVAEAPAPVQETAQVIDLMEALKASLAGAGGVKPLKRAASE